MELSDSKMLDLRFGLYIRSLVRIETKQEALPSSLTQRIASNLLYLASDRCSTQSSKEW